VNSRDFVLTHGAGGGVKGTGRGHRRGRRREGQDLQDMFEEKEKRRERRELETGRIVVRIE